MNDSRIYRNMKIAWNNSAVKLGCSDWCDLQLNATERISEHASYSKRFRFHENQEWLVYFESWQWKPTVFVAQWTQEGRLFFFYVYADIVEKLRTLWVFLRGINTGNPERAKEG